MSTRIVNVLDNLLGTTSFHGEVIRNRRGIFTNGESFELPDIPIVLDIDPCTPRRHARLKGQRRCLGCGRTLNEIAIDGDVLVLPETYP